MEKNHILALLGVYDVFSAKISAEKFEGVFCSGFSYAASSYGLPDIGFTNWRDTLDFTTKIRHAIPDLHILVDIDDGFGDEIIAANTVKNLEANGLSAVMMEDQKRPRRCGHFKGKEVLSVEEYLVKLQHVIRVRNSIFVIARRDTTGHHEGLDRAIRYSEAGADGIMVEAVRDLNILKELVREVNCPVMVNQLHGGKTPNWALSQLEDIGVSIVIYSTPCLFAAQYAMERYIDEMKKTQSLPSQGTVTLDQCMKVLDNR